MRSKAVEEWCAVYELGINHKQNGQNGQNGLKGAGHASEKIKKNCAHGNFACTFSVCSCFFLLGKEKV